MPGFLEPLTTPLPRRPIVPLVALGLALACGDSLVGPVPAEFRQAPEQVTIAGVVLALEAETWRDFMPGDRPDTRLHGVIRLRGVTGTVPSDAHVEAAWVLFGNVAWFAPLRHDATDLWPWRFSGGPEWPVGELVDVVVRLRGPEGGDFLLAKRGVPIRQVW